MGKKGWRRFSDPSRLLTVDRGLSARRHANAVSILHFARCAFLQYIRGGNLSHCADLTGIHGDGGAGDDPAGLVLEGATDNPQV